MYTFDWNRYVDRLLNGSFQPDKFRSEWTEEDNDADVNRDDAAKKVNKKHLLAVNGGIRYELGRFVAISLSIQSDGLIGRGNNLSERVFLIQEFQLQQFVLSF